jgi:hypothetical protein
MESLFSRENFVDDFQEEREKTIIQQGIVEDMAEEMEPKKNVEVSTYAPPSDEVIQDLVSPARQKDDEVSFFPFQDFDDTLFHDLENEGEMEAVGYDMDPIYDIESHFQVFPLELSQQITLDQWQQGNEFFTHILQTPKDDLVPCFHDDFQSYLEGFDDYPFEHLDSFHENDYQPPPCSGLDKSNDLLGLKEDPCDDFPQPPLINSPCYVSIGVVGKYVFDFEFPLGQTLESKGWLNITSLSLSYQFFNFSLRIFQSSDTSLSIPSKALKCENVPSSQCADLLSQCYEPWDFHDPFRRWIECFPQRWTWQYFIPPTCLHELDFMISDDIIYALTHVIFVLDFSLF